MPPVELMIRELPEGERPRERLLEQGSGALSDAELIAVMLRTGRVGVSAIQMALELLRESGGLSGLLGATPLMLRRSGLGPAKAASLLAAIEIGRRLAREQILDREPMARPAEVARYLSLRYRLRDQEVMGAIFLDTRKRFLSDKEIYRGTINQAVVEPREVLKECLLRGATGLVLFHTHPSGDPSPSADDIEFTRRLAQAANVIGVLLVDHLILASSGRWVSLKERGIW
ncbi:MAG TPA: DNA repair protein RadC [Thermoanaerobaculia bacterium]|nr:DNA repair protein RadC [Thermoanaerobaculia bacterium]